MSEPASSLDKQVSEGLKDLNQSLNIYFVFSSCHHKINETNINRVGNVLRTMRHFCNHDILISILYKLINFVTAQCKRRDLYAAVTSFSRHPTVSNWKKCDTLRKTFLLLFWKDPFTYPHFFHICVSTHLDNTPLRYSNPRTPELMKNIMRNAQLYFSRVSFFTPVNPENKFHSIHLFLLSLHFCPVFLSSQNSVFRNYT